MSRIRYGGLFFLLTALLSFLIFLTDSRSVEASKEITIRGNTFDDITYKPINQVKVEVSTYGYTQRLIAQTHTDENGKYTIAGCPTDTNLKLICSKDGYKTCTIELFLPSNFKTFTQDVPLEKVTARASDKVKPKGMQVAIRVADKQTQNTISAAKVMLSMKGFSASALTNQDGKVLISGVPVGKGKVSCRAQGYATGGTDITVRDRDYAQYFNVLLTKTPTELKKAEFKRPKKLKSPPTVEITPSGPAIHRQEERAAAMNGDFKTPIISLNGRRICAREGDGSLKLFNRNGIELSQLWAFPNEENAQERYRFLANDISYSGDYVAVAGWQIMKFAGNRSNPLLWSFSDCGTCSCIAISGDGEYVVSGDDRGNVYLFKGNTFEENGFRNGSEKFYKWELRRELGEVLKIDISKDGDYIAVGGSKAIYLLFNNRTKDIKPLLSRLPRKTKFISVSDNGRYIAANTEQGTDSKLYLFDRDDENSSWERSIESDQTPSSVISKDGSYIALGTNEKVFEFSKDSQEPIWSCEKADYQTVVDISADGKYVYANEGRINSGDRWMRRTYLFARDYLARRPHSEKAFAVYDVLVGGGEWVSMTRHGEVLVFLDGGNIWLEEPTPTLLMDIDLDIDGAPFYSSSSPRNKQHLRFFIANPGQAVPAAILEAAVYFPQIGFLGDIPELTVTESRYTTVEDVIADVALDSIGSYHVVDPTNVPLAAHKDADLRIVIGIKNVVAALITEIAEDMGLPGWLADLAGKVLDDAEALNVLPIGLAAMTVGELRADNPRFRSGDCVGWMYLDLVVSDASKQEFEDATGIDWDYIEDVAKYLPGLLGEDGEAAPDEEPQEGQVPAQDIDLKPVSFTIADQDASGEQNPTLEAGKEYVLKIGIENMGSEDLLSIVVDVDVATDPDSGTPTGPCTIAFIPSNQVRYARLLDKSFNPGSYTFTIAVNPEGALPERSLANNIMFGSATFLERGAQREGGREIRPEIATIGPMVVPQQIMPPVEIPAQPHAQPPAEPAGPPVAPARPLAVPAEPAQPFVEPAEPPEPPVETEVPAEPAAPPAEEGRPADWLLLIGNLVNRAVNRPDIVTEAGPPAPGTGSTVAPAPAIPVVVSPVSDSAVSTPSVAPDVDVSPERKPAAPALITGAEISGRESVQEQKRLRALGLWTIWILLALYIYLACSLQIIAKKTSTPGSWLAWIPLANIYLTCKIAQKPALWLLLFLVPLVNIVIAIIVWEEIAKARNKASWLGILIIVPIINFFIPGYLAFSE